MRNPKLGSTATSARLECIPEHGVPLSLVSLRSFPVSTGARIAFAHALGSDARAWRVFVQLGYEADPLVTEVSADTAHAVLAQMRKTAEAQPGAYPFTFLHRVAHLLPMPPTPLPATQRPVLPLPAARHLRIVDDAGLDTHAKQQPQSHWAPAPRSPDVPASKELGGFYAPYVIGQPRMCIDRCFRMQHCRAFHGGGDGTGARCTAGVHCNFIHFDFWVRGAGHREFQLCRPSAPEGEPCILAVVVPEFDFQRFMALEALVDHPINQHNIGRFVAYMSAKYSADRPAWPTILARPNGF